MERKDKAPTINIKVLNINDIIPYPMNPRDNVDAVYAVESSIEKFGYQQPIIVTKEHVVIAGHTRLKALKAMGVKEVPVIVSNLSAEDADAYRLADNKTGEIAQWNYEMLESELDRLKEQYDMGEFGFSDEDIEQGQDDMAEEMKKEADVPPPERQYKVVIDCKDEKDQKEILKKVQGYGFSAQPISF